MMDGMRDFILKPFTRISEYDLLVLSVKNTSALLLLTSNLNLVPAVPFTMISHLKLP